ncbi:MAG: hypothetical protein KF703_13695 [Actinobacteria bacterium]|nr:hypothetical protein [Actinomycetota bacterium]
MKERILAVVGAVALVTVAVVLRATVLDDGSDGGSGGGGGGRPHVACTPDLAGVCRALADAGAIAADPAVLELGDATAPPDDLDGWITWDGAPGVANIDAPGTWQDPVAVAGAPLAVARRTGPAPALPAGCTADALTWRCLVDAALDGDAVGVGTGTSAESLVRLGPIAAALVPADGDVTDIDAADLRAVIDSPADPQDLFPTQLVALRTRLGALTWLVGPEPALRAADDLVVLRPAGAAVPASVVLSATRSGRVGDLARRLQQGAPAEALRDAGVEPGAGRLAVDPGEQYAVRDEVG